MSTSPAARVGVVVRTQGRPWFLRRALRDIAGQRFFDLAVVVVNDGGDAAEVDRAVRDASGLAGRVSVIHEPGVTGRSAAANRGLRELDTPYVVLHDDDDLWHPDFLARTVAHLDAHDELGAVMVRTEIVYERREADGYAETGRVPYWPAMTDVTYADFLQVNRAVPIGVLYRRSVHDAVGFYREDLAAVEDWDFYLRLLLGFRSGFLDGEALAYWMQRTEAQGADGNSMFVLAGEHDAYDRMLRDEALREYVGRFGAGLPLYLSRYIEQEVARQLGEQAGIGPRIVRWARARRRGRQTR